MRPQGHRWRTLKARFKQDSRNRRSPCHLCGQPIDYDAPPQHRDSFEADHIHPVRDRPDLAYVYGNLAPAHSRCNRARQTDRVKTWVQPSW